MKIKKRVHAGPAELTDRQVLKAAIGATTAAEPWNPREHNGPYRSPLWPAAVIVRRHRPLWSNAMAWRRLDNFVTRAGGWNRLGLQAWENAHDDSASSWGEMELIGRDDAAADFQTAFDACWAVDPLPTSVALMKKLITSSAFSISNDRGSENYPKFICFLGCLAMVANQARQAVAEQQQSNRAERAKDKFFLSNVQAGKLFRVRTRTAGKWLQDATADGHVERLTIGSNLTRKASKYRASKELVLQISRALKAQPSSRKK